MPRTAEHLYLPVRLQAKLDEDLSMLNYVVYPQIQENKDCNILHSLSNTAAYVSQAKKINKAA